MHGNLNSRFPLFWNRSIKFLEIQANKKKVDLLIKLLLFKKSKLITATSTPVIESPVREENRLNIGRKYTQEKLQEIETYLAGLKRVKSVGPAV
jgi:hypothetical protein